MYGKIFDSIYNGTLYGKWEALVTMQQLIVLADADGTVDMTPMAISARTGIPREIIDKGLEILASPDKYTRTPGSDGKRIELLDEHRPWGWSLVNYDKYKNLRDADEVRAQNRERKRRQRAREKSQDVTLGHAESRHIDIDIDIDKDKTYRATKRVPKKWSPSQKLCDFAIDCGMTAKEVEEQLEAFRDHEYKTAKKDWDACWRTWCRNWKKWSKDKPRGKLSYAEQLAEDMKSKGML